MVKYKGFLARFTMIQEQRSVSRCTQFVEVFRRNLKYLFRNPVLLRFTIFNAIVIALLTLSLFYHVGYWQEATTFQQAITNWGGLSLTLTNNMMFPSIQAVILQMPMQVTVFKRETMNKMYSPSLYFFARVFSGMLLQICYPIIMATIIFFGLGTQDTLENYLLFLATAIQLNLVGCAVGYCCGVGFENENVARPISTFLNLFFMLLSGGLANLDSPFIK